MKKTLIALMALAGVACAATITKDTTMSPGGNYYGGEFDFTFELPEVLTESPVYLLGYYATTAADGNYSGNVFTLLKDDNGVITLSFDRVASLTVTDNTITGVGTVHNSSVFKSEGSTYALTAGSTYTVEYLGGTNDSAAANLLLDGAVVASFTGGAHNMNGGGANGTATLNVKVNEAYVIPEPTTATLSLLALAGLAARRRRK